MPKPSLSTLKTKLSETKLKNGDEAQITTKNMHRVIDNPEAQTATININPELQVAL